MLLNCFRYYSLIKENYRLHVLPIFFISEIVGRIINDFSFSLLVPNNSIILHDSVHKSYNVIQHSLQFSKQAHDFPHDVSQLYNAWINLLQKRNKTSFYNLSPLFNFKTDLLSCWSFCRVCTVHCALQCTVYCCETRCEFIIWVYIYLAGPSKKSFPSF